MKALHANLSPFHATKLVAMATSLDRTSTNFCRMNLFIDGVNARTLVEIRALVAE